VPAAFPTRMRGFSEKKSGRESSKGSERKRLARERKGVAGNIDQNLPMTGKTTEPEAVEEGTDQFRGHEINWMGIAAWDEILLRLKEWIADGRGDFRSQLLLTRFSGQ